MTFSIKPLEFELLEGTDIYSTQIKISDILNVTIQIRPTRRNYMDISIGLTTYTLYQVKFHSSTECKAFLFGEDNNFNTYTKRGFESFEDAKEYAINEYNERMNTFLENVLKDIYKVVN